jgi:hypothetical protein
MIGNSKIKYLALGVIFLLFIPPVQSLGTQVVWSDNFDDGDLNGWTVYGFNFTSETDTLEIWDGGASVDDGQLVIGGDKRGDDEKWTILGHESTLEYGKWSFDWYLGPDHEISNAFWFVITPDLETWVSKGFYNDSNPITGYRIWFGDWGCALQRIVNSSFVFDKSYQSQLADGWYHYEIHRLEDGTISVYLDDEMIITAFVSPVESPMETQILAGYGSKWDNIEASKWIEESDDDDSIGPEYAFVLSSLTLIAFAVNRVRYKK